MPAKPLHLRHQQPVTPGLHRPSTPPGYPPASARREGSKLSFGTVCSSNINRSMEAHVVLSNAGMKVESYGTGTQVRLPGKSAMEPRIFKFGTPYAEMYRSLSATPEDEAFFVHNGVLQLCKRGAAVKLAPQRWQDTPSDDIQKHDVVIAFEERIYDAVVEDLQAREPTEDFKALHVICLDTKDNPHEAQLQGRVALELCWLLERTDDLDVEAPELIERFQEEQMTHTQIKFSRIDITNFRHMARSTSRFDRSSFQGLSVIEGKRNNKANTTTINTDFKTYKERSERRRRTSSLAQSHQIREIISKTVEELSARNGNISENSCSESAEDVLKKVLAEAKESGFSANRIFSILSSTSISETDGVPDDMIKKETFSAGLIKLSKGIHSWKKKDLDVIAEKFDINGDGLISFAEFQHYCYHEVPSVAWKAERQRKEAQSQAAQKVSTDTEASFNLKDISYAPGHVMSSRSKIFWKINLSVEIVLRYCSELGVISIQLYDTSTKTDFKTLYVNKSSCTIDRAALQEAMTKDDKSPEDVEWEHYSNYIVARLQIVKDENEQVGYVPSLLKLHNDGDRSLEIEKPHNMNAPAKKYSESIKSGKSLEDEFQQKVRSFEKESRSARSSRQTAEGFIRSARNSRNTADGEDSLENIMRQALEEVKLELGEN